MLRGRRFFSSFKQKINSEVVDFYANSNVLLTGGTGFFGKVLTQKLLRTCQDVQGIYLIVRTKNGSTANQRYKEIFQDTLFDTLKREQPNFQKKIHLLEGDCALPNLGLTKSSGELLSEKINVVFHCAATLNFRSALKTAVETNVRSLRDLLQLCHGISNLKSFVYVSTAYSNCTERLIEERFYNPPIQPKTLIKLVEDLNETTLNSITDGLLQSWPNTYCYTKCVSENLLLQERKNLPVSIFRPSMVISTSVEPIPGWTSNLYGPIGFIYFVAQGILRVVKSNKNITFDIVPVDMAVNALICSAWETNHTHETHPTPIKIYNYSAGSKFHYSMMDPINIGRNYPHLCNKKPWYPFLVLTNSSEMFKIYWFFLQTLPAHLTDFIFKIRGKNLKMVKMNDQVKGFITSVDYFLNKQIDIDQENVNRLWNCLKHQDQKLFPFEIDLLDKKKYNENFATGMQLYINRQPLRNRQECLKRHKRLKITHYSVVGFLVSIIAWLFYKIIMLF